MSDAGDTGAAGPHPSLSACVRNLHALRDQILVAWGERLDLEDEERSRLREELARTCRLLQALTAQGNPAANDTRVMVTEDHLDSLLHARRARADIFGADIFSDPAWDILLELYAAKLGARTMTAVELARAIRTPTSTTIRWIGSLQQRGLIAPVLKGSDDEHFSILLTETASLQMERLAQNWATAFVSI